MHERDLSDMTTYLALGVCPKFHNHGNQIVQGSVGTLVRQDSSERGEGEEGQAGLHTPVERTTGDERQRPLPSQHPYTYNQI